MEDLNLVFSKFGFNFDVKTLLISFLERELSELTTRLFEELKNSQFQQSSKDSKENIQKQILHFLFIFCSFLQQQIETQQTKNNQQLQIQLSSSSFKL